jgi:threonine/homoserine/homoserine lactone efflux protein
MEWITLLLKGLLIGFVAVIPPGPVAVVCIQRTLSSSRRSGFASGMGSATTDMVYAIVAVFFLSMVLSFLEQHIDLLKIVGGICVGVIGVTILLKNPVEQIRRNRAGQKNLWGDYLSTMGLSLANPVFILMLIALFVTFGVGENLTNAGGAALVGGIFVGEGLWWLVLVLSVGLLRKDFRPRHLLWLNRIAGTVLVLAGVAAAASVLIR